MKRSALLIFLLCTVVSISEAQLWKLKRYEAVAGLGTTQFFGDIGGYSVTKNVLGIKDMSFLQTRVNFSFNFKYRITQEINVRLGLTAGLLHATDERGSNKKRGFEAKIFIFEPDIIGEYYFIKNRNENSYLFVKGRKVGLRGFLKSLDFYAFTGIGGLGYSVNENAKLKAIGMKDGGFTGVIPVGLGSTLVYTPYLNLGLEIGGRYSFTDYLDGYTSQYSSSNDVYYFCNFTVTYKLKTSSKGFPSFR
jgi:hypothetical protein